MRLAIDAAWRYQGLTYPNPAVGCTVVGEHGEILAVEAHTRAGLPHAEVNALQQAYYKLTNDSYILALEKSVDIHTHLLANHNNIFQNCSLYTTLEPCSHYGKTPSCATLISELGIKRVYIGSSDTNAIAKNGTMRLQMSGTEVYSELLEEECNALLYPFKRTLEENFIFFKWAQRLSGTSDAGIISSEYSRRSVHAMRDVCDLLVVGGETVRQDRPTLDARLVGGEAPDVLILSHESDFDRDIPLFHVKGRQVFIEKDLQKLSEYKNIMIEGGASMYAYTHDIVDYYLCYLAPTFGGSRGINFQDDSFEILNQRKEDKDIIMWMKRI